MSILSSFFLQFKDDFNTKRMSLHLIGEEESRTRVAVCKFHFVFWQIHFVFWQNTPKKQSEFEFWVCAGETEDGQLVTCSTSAEASFVLQCQGGCEEIPQDNSKDEKKGQQMKGRVNNRGVLQIAVSVSNKRSTSTRYLVSLQVATAQIEKKL